MDLFWFLFIACSAYFFSISSADNSKDYKDELIANLLKENEEMKLKLAELTSGLLETCKTLIREDSPGESKSIDASTHPVAAKANETDNDLDNIKVISIKSHGLVNDTLRLTLEFETSFNYTVDWHQVFNIGNGLFWTGGKVSRSKISGNRFLYSCNVEFYDIKLTYNINARIHNTKYSVSFDFNMTSVVEDGIEMFKEIEYQIIEFSPLLILPENLRDNFTVVLRVQNNTKSIGNNVLGSIENEIPLSQNQIDVAYTWVNTTSDPNSIKNLHGPSDINIVSSALENNTYEYFITLKTEHVVNGGLLEFLLRQPVNHYRFIDNLSYGVFIELVRKNSMSYIPPQVLVLYNDGQTMYRVSSYVSVFCLAMGNPRPTIQVFKDKNGRMKELRAKELTPDAVTSLKYVTVKETSKKRSKFICKTTNGNKTLESETRVELYKDIIFDEKKTGVVKNTTKRVIVSCKAHSNPLPNLEMRLGSMSGPDLMNAAGNFIKRNNTKSSSVGVRIIFSPPDNRYDVIYCVATQSEMLFSNMVHKKIVVHPHNYQTIDSSERFRFYQTIQDMKDRSHL